MLLGDTVCEPKKFDLVQQTVSPCERVGSGDETTYLYAHVGVHKLAS